MNYREATVSKLYPPMDEQQIQRFCYEFSHLCKIATQINAGSVVEEGFAFYAMAYFYGWKWRQTLLVDVGKGIGYPEVDFVNFVHDITTRLGIVEYDKDHPANREAFEQAAEGRYNLVRKSGSEEYAFNAAKVYDGWCLAFSDRANK